MVTCAGCPYGTFGQRTGIQRSSATPVYGLLLHHAKTLATQRRNHSGGAPARERRRSDPVRGLRGVRPPGRKLPYAEAVSSSKKPRVLFGSTGMPGAMVVVKVIFLR